MATTTSVPTPAPPPESPVVGTFVSCASAGYLEPAEDVVRRLNDYLKTLSKGTSPTFLKALLTIKLLAPEESEDLVICNVPMAVDFISMLRDKLVMHYYHVGQKV